LEEGGGEGGEDNGGAGDGGEVEGDAAAGVLRRAELGGG